jgi:hypothetical protein
MLSLSFPLSLLASADAGWADAALAQDATVLFFDSTVAVNIIIRRILAAFGNNHSLLALIDFWFCCCNADCCRVVAKGFVLGFLMVELVL